MSGWSCPHNVNDRCIRLKCECKPGRPGCVLKGKVVFASDDTEPSHHEGAKTRRGLKDASKKKPK